jgi:CRP/FNR family cyclic AMP-dependent transcriptional regulator
MVAEDDVAAWRRIAPSIVVQEFRDSARIFGQGDEAQFLYFILKGVVKLSHVTEKGGQLTISVLGSGLN